MFFDFLQHRATKVLARPWPGRARSMASARRRPACLRADIGDSGWGASGEMPLRKQPPDPASSRLAPRAAGRCSYSAGAGIRMPRAGMAARPSRQRSAQRSMVQNDSQASAIDIGRPTATTTGQENSARSQRTTG